MIEATGKEIVEELAQKLIDEGEHLAIEEGKELIKDGEKALKKIEHEVFHDVETAVLCTNEKSSESATEINKRLIIFGTVFVASVIVTATTFFLIRLA